MDWLLNIAKPFILKQVAVLARNLAVLAVGALLTALAKFSITLPPDQVDSLQATLTLVLVGLVSWAMTSHFKLATKAATLDAVKAAVTNPAMAGQPVLVQFDKGTYHSLTPAPVEVSPLPPVEDPKFTSGGQTKL